MYTLGASEYLYAVDDDSWHLGNCGHSDYFLGRVLSIGRSRIRLPLKVPDTLGLNTMSTAEVKKALARYLEEECTP